MDVPNGYRALFNLLLAGEHFFGSRVVDGLTFGLPDRLQARLADRLAREGPGCYRDVERRRDIDPREFRDRYVARGIPVVLEGLARDWPCTHEWDLDFFRERYGDHPILRRGLEGFDRPDQRGTERAREQTLGEAIDEMRGGASTYVRFGTVVDAHPELQRMLDLQVLERLRNPRTLTAAYNFFAGRAGTITGLHCAILCNLFVMVHGRKRWTLYSPRSTAALRPRATRGQYFYSDVDPDAPDIGRFPAFPFVDGYQFVLEQGDVLYNPPYVWHHVVNLTDTIGVGYRFTHAGSSLRASATLLMLRLFAWDPPPWATLAAFASGRGAIRTLVERRTAPRHSGPGRE
jgi:hypothetical protein